MKNETKKVCFLNMTYIRLTPTLSLNNSCSGTLAIYFVYLSPHSWFLGPIKSYHLGMWSDFTNMIRSQWVRRFHDLCSRDVGPEAQKFKWHSQGHRGSLERYEKPRVPDLSVLLANHKTTRLLRTSEIFPLLLGNWLFRGVSLLGSFCKIPWVASRI